MKITACKINHLSNPIGYELSSPRISWNVEGCKGTRQESARIIIGTDKKLKNIIFDTDWADLNSLGQSISINMLPRTRYFYTVSVRTNEGEEATSAVNFFETGKLTEKWDAKWISCKDNGNAGPDFVKAIELKDAVESARLYVTGLGLYEVFYNGKRIGDEYLTPYCNNYNKWIQYQTYDVTENLDANGKLEIVLGNGWYKGRFGFSSKEGHKGYYGNKYMLLAELRIRYKNGKEEVIGTDDTWNVEKTAITFSNIYDGEVRDDTLLNSENNENQKAVILSKAKTPKAELTERFSQPVKIIEERKVDLLTTPNNEIVLDVGQNITGSFRLKVHIPKGRKLHLLFGEVLQDGNFYRDNLRTARAEYTYISDGCEKVIQPQFTFYGYRYVKVEGFDEIKAEDFTALAFSTEMEETGSLKTGNRLVNRLISNIRWGCKDNFVDVPTDCPQRDERMGWTADTQVFSPSATYMNDSYAFYRKYLFDMSKEQEENDGGVPYTIPSFGTPSGSSVWGDAATIIPWMLYEFYDDITIINEQYESMRSWVDFITAKDGDDFGWRKEFHFGDWLALDVPGADVSATSGATDLGFIADVYYMYSAEIVADAAMLTGRVNDSEKYRNLANRIRGRIRDEYFSLNGRCCCDTQTGLVLTLQHNLADKEKTSKRLREKFEANKFKLDCGFVGAPLLCKILTENGMSDIAEKLLLNEEFPGWLHEVKLGATTVWERWNSLDDNGHISSTGMNSLNHYAYGSILEWMYAHLAGIKQLEPGFRSVRFEPKPIYKLKHLSASYRSASGLWETSWKMPDKKHIEIHITVPFGAKAEVVLPEADKSVFKDKKNPMFNNMKNGICYLEAGSYDVKLNLK